MKPDRWETVLRVVALLFVVGLSLVLYANRDQIQNLERYGYPGIFLFNLLSSATLILPVPGVAITSIMGAVFEPFWVALAAGAGAALGELSGYLVGFSGQRVVERTAAYDKVETFMKKYGVWAVLALAFVPNPLFDIAGFVAGASRMPVQNFLIWCFIGKVLKMLMFAYFGNWLIPLFPFL